MSPERARIFHAEDNAEIRKTVKLVMESGGHEVVLQADTLQSALESANNAAEMSLDVAILDGNLGPSTDCADGRQIAAALREVKPGITIVSLSGSDEADFGDITIPKSDIEAVFALPKVIDEL